MVTRQRCPLRRHRDPVEDRKRYCVGFSTIARLAVEPDQCIAFEDSLAGVRSAKRAGARVFAVPDRAERSNPGFAIADVVLESLTDFSLDLVEGRGKDRR